VTARLAGNAPKIVFRPGLFLSGPAVSSLARRRSRAAALRYQSRQVDEDIGTGLREVLQLSRLTSPTCAVRWSTATFPGHPPGWPSRISLRGIFIGHCPYAIAGAGWRRPGHQRAADPMAGAGRHQQRGAVPGLRWSALHHRRAAASRCRIPRQV